MNQTSHIVYRGGNDPGNRRAGLPGLRVAGYHGNPWYTKRSEINVVVGIMLIRQ